MPARPTNFNPPSTISRTVLRDIHGRVILEIGLDDYMVQNADGSITQYKTSTNIQLTDGAMWNPGMLMANPPVYVMVCELCRHPPFIGFGRQSPTHGICTQARTRMCAGCGLLCCPKHRYKHGDDWLCPSCHRRRHLRAFLESIFFIKAND